MRYNWDWSLIYSNQYLPLIVSGLEMTLAVSVISWILALALGIGLGVARTVEQPLVRAVAAVYVEFFRNIPIVVVFFLWYFVVPELLPRGAGLWLKRDMPFPEFWTSVAALSSYTAARIAEQVKAGIQSIPSSQSQAAMASGLTRFQVYRFILAPVGLRMAVPALSNEFITIFKNSSLALTIGLLEITSRTRQISEYTYHPIELFTVATVLYGLIALVATLIMSRIEHATLIPGMISKTRAGSR